MHHLLVVGDDLFGPFVGLRHDLLDLRVDLVRGRFRIVLRAAEVPAQEDLPLRLAEGERSELAHAPFADHLAGEIGRLFDVVPGAGRHVAEEPLFGDAAAHHDGDRRLEVFLRVRVLVLDRELHRHAQRAAARDDRDLVDRVGVREHRGDEGVAALVVRRVLLLLFGHDHRLALGTHHHLVLRVLEVDHLDLSC